MKNRKKLAPALLLVLALALAPLSRAGERTTVSLGPLEWLKVWIASLVEEVAEVGLWNPDQLGSEEPEHGNVIVPSG